MKLQVIVIIALVSLIVAACGEALDNTRPTAIPTLEAGATSAVKPNPTVVPGSISVETEIYRFTFEKPTVQVGTTVTWINVDSANHTVTSGRPGDITGLWDSGRLSQDDTFSYTFTEVGVFPYFCQIHLHSMVSTVTAVETLEGQAPSAPADATQTSDSDTASYDY